MFSRKQDILSLVMSTAHILGLDHIQLAAPAGCEPAAREFFSGILGLPEIPKPPELLARGGVWFQCGPSQIHIGVETNFRPALKAHPAFLVENLNLLRQELQALNIAVLEDDSVPYLKRLYVNDPWGNRLEFIAR